MSIFSVLPPTELLAPFMVAGLALNLTPGSDMTFVALCGMRGGRRAGVAAAAGISVGGLVHTLLAVVGLSALIAASQTAFAIVKWIGVVYLVYLAVQLLRERGAVVDEALPVARYNPKFAFRQAAIVNILNPKVGIFFLAFLPQFVEPGLESAWLQILALGIIFNLSGAIVNGLVGILSARAATRFTASRLMGRAIRALAATIMGGLAVKLALTRND